MKILEAFKFGRDWLDWVYSCFSSVKYSVLINSSPCGFFECTRELRHGDSLSLFLFMFMADTLSRLIKSCKSNGLWRGIKVAETMEHLTCQQFADDTMLYGKGCKKADPKDYKATFWLQLLFCLLQPYTSCYEGLCLYPIFTCVIFYLCFRLGLNSRSLKEYRLWFPNPLLFLLVLVISLCNSRQLLAGS